MPTQDPRGVADVDPQRMQKVFRLFVLTYLMVWSWLQIAG